MRTERVCVACRSKKPVCDLIRLTVDFGTQIVKINPTHDQSKRGLIQGRSAYMCRLKSCVTRAIKGNKLKFALEGRRPKKSVQKRSVTWPLESQLIYLISNECTDA